MIRYRLTHRTTYEYSVSASLCHNEARLHPRTWGPQRCLNHVLEVEPGPAAMTAREDYFGNVVHYFSVEVPHTRLDVTSISEVDVDWPTSVDDPKESWEIAAARTKEAQSEAFVDARSFRLGSPFVPLLPELVAYGEPSFVRGRSVIEAVRDLTSRIFHDFVFDPTSTCIATPIGEVIAKRRGVCQDFAHLAIGCVRSYGLAARYVSGYLETIPPEGQEKLVGADASHAWLSVFVPELGWLDFDPTNDLFPVSSHVILGWGRDYGDVTPLKGVVTGGGPHWLNVSVDVARLDAAVVE